MGISINSISLDPQNITPARVPLSVKYNGFVDSAPDNPVTITMTLENGTSVYIAENTTDEKKAVTWTDNLPLGNAAGLEKKLYVGIDPADAGKTCTVYLHFQPKSGGVGDDEQTHFNF
jgi:hypothetical protein